MLARILPTQGSGSIEGRSMTRLSWAVWLAVRIASALIVAIAIAIALTAPAPAFTEGCDDHACPLSRSGDEGDAYQPRMNPSSTKCRRSTRGCGHPAALRATCVEW